MTVFFSLSVNPSRSTTPRVHPPSGSHPALSSAADSRKHSAPVPPPRSVPAPISPRFALLGPESSGSPAVVPRRRLWKSSSAALAVVCTSCSAVPLLARPSTPSTLSTQCPRSAPRPPLPHHHWLAPVRRRGTEY